MKKTSMSKLLIFLLLSGNAYAIKSKKKVRKRRRSVKRIYTRPKRPQVMPYVLLSTAFETNLHKTDDPDKIFINTTSLSGGIKTLNGYKTSLTLGVDKDFEDQRETTLRDLVLNGTKVIGNLAEHINFSAHAAITLPTSKFSRSSSLRTALSLSPQFLYDASYDISNGLSLVYRPYFKTYFHQYQNQNNGSSNVQYALTNRFIISYLINDQLSFSLDNLYSRNWTYVGNTGDHFSFDQSVSYNFSPGVSSSLGHAIGGSALAVNGQESDVRYFDKRNSTFYISLNLSF